MSESIRELRLREPAEVRELERLALRVGEARERALHALALEPEQRVVLDAAGAGRLRCRLERLSPAALLAPDDVDGPPVDAGWPNGRRLEDDVVDISERAVAGALIGKSLPLGDGVDANDRANLRAFPYEPDPRSGFDNTKGVAFPVTGDGTR